MENKNITSLQQPNVITQARYSFSQQEMNVLLYIIKAIQKQINNLGYEYNRKLFGDQDYKMFFHLSDIDTSETNLKRIKAAIKELRRKDFEINDSKDWLNVGFINYGQYNYAEKKWELQVSHKLMPYMVNVAEGYTEFQLNVVLRLNSHAQRLYMMMSQWNDTGFFVVNANDLRFKLGLEKRYDKYFNFKNRVINSAQKELAELFKIDKSDLYFALVEDKKRKDGVDDFDRLLKFKVFTNDAKAKINEDERVEYMNACVALLRKAYPEKDRLVSALYHHVFKAKRLKEFTDRLFKIQEKSQAEGKAFYTYAALITHILIEDFGWKRSTSQVI